MASQTTSKIAPVVIGSGRMKSTTYIASKVTGPVVGEDGKPFYSSEIVQYSDAAGGNPVVIGNRNAETGDITWNSNASGRTKLNESKFLRASSHQIQSLENQITSNSSERSALNRAAGRSNEDITDGGNIYSKGDNSKAIPFLEGANIMEQLGGITGLMGGKGGKARQRYDRDLCYPLSLKRQQQDTLRITVLKYRPKKHTGDSLSFNQRTEGTPIGAVTLPIPGGVSDRNAVDWNMNEMNAAQIAASQLVKEFLGKGGEATAEKAQAMFETASKNDGVEVKKALANMFTESLTGTSNILARTEGMVLNPNMELLFKGPSLRPFTFQYKVSPREERESMMLLKIIRMFKQSMLPQRSQSSLFLKAPNTYKLQFQSPHGAKTHRFLPKIKECALLDFSVNYTPDGNYMTYDNSSMVSYEISFSFKELEPVYNDDMDNRDYDIGY